MDSSETLQFVFDWKLAKKYDNTNRWESSLFKGIPMKYRDIPEMVSYLRANNCYVRYRGPRRPGRLGQQMCLKKDATHFSIYRRQEERNVCS